MYLLQCMCLQPEKKDNDPPSVELRVRGQDTDALITLAFVGPQVCALSGLGRASCDLGEVYSGTIFQENGSFEFREEHHELAPGTVWSHGQDMKDTCPSLSTPSSYQPFPGGRDNSPSSARDPLIRNLCLLPQWMGQPCPQTCLLGSAKRALHLWNLELLHG